MYFRDLIIRFPRKKTVVLHLNKVEFPFSRMLCAKFGWNWLVGSREEDKNGKNLQTDGRTTDDQKSSLELIVQVS